MNTIFQCLVIMRVNHNVNKILDSSKQRMRLNKKLSMVQEKLKEKVKAYNEVARTLHRDIVQGVVNGSTVWPWIRRGNNFASNLSNWV